MTVKYQILVDQKFLDTWIDKFIQWKKQSKEIEFDKNIELLSSSIENLILTMQKNKVVVGKYNAFDLEVYNGYIEYVKDQIFKNLPLLEERGEWRKHLQTIINEFTGADAVLVPTISFVSVISKLETLKDCPDFPPAMSKEDLKKHPEFIRFRKTIFETMGIAENLTLTGDRDE